MKEDTHTAPLVLPDKKNILPVSDIPVEGSLGLLALGAVGLKAWRKKKEKANARKEKK